MSGEMFDISGGGFSAQANQVLDPADLFGARAAQKQKDAINESAQAQLTASSQNVALQRDIFSQQQAAQEPWRVAGAKALEAIQSTPDFNFTSDTFEQFKDPSYDFRMQEGVNALDRSAASRGRLLSGAQDRAVTRYGSDLASQEYGNAFNRAQNVYTTNLNTKKSLAGVGQEANAQNAQSSNALSQGLTAQNRSTADALSQQQIQNANAIMQQQQQTSSTVGAGIGLLAAFSDERLKDNIQYLRTENGHKVYSWDWKDDKIKDKNIGVIAQEVEKYMPEAVFEDKESRFLKVRYDLLGLENV